MRVEWPVGPQIWEQGQPEGLRAWVLYKLASADWYIGRLKTLSKRLGRLEHQVGVEMALDGALQSLCSAIDAACGGVIQAAEAAAAKGRPIKNLPPPQSVKRAEAELRKARRTRAVKALGKAMARRKDEEPNGWLAQLRWLRNRAVHQTTLVRVRYGGGAFDGEVHVKVPGLGYREPLTYLADVRGKVEALATLLLAEVDRLTPAGQVIGGREDDVLLTVSVAATSGSVLTAEPVRVE
jgi:hypothetical protein